MKCRHCDAELNLVFVDLGAAPPSNAYLTAAALHAPETWYPLRVLVCEQCWLVQTEDFADAAELFDADYAYFSGVSATWRVHVAEYVSNMIQRFGLTRESWVVEVAANDGSLLECVVASGIPCLGIEPTASTARAARAKGITVVEEFFGTASAKRLAAERGGASLIAANNVLAHVPQINDFVRGFAELLATDGVATFEFPRLPALLEQSQFDTIYHEHFSYLSLTAVARIFEANGLSLFDVETLTTHGGSYRVFAQRSDAGCHRVSERVAQTLRLEEAAGMRATTTYAGFQARVERAKNELLAFLLEAKREGKRVAAYGAAAKGNTLLNFAGVRPDLIAFVVDRSPGKIGKYLPGSRIPIVAEDQLRAETPDYVLLLPWNLTDELRQQLNYVQQWGGRLVTCIPRLQVWEPVN